MFTYRPGAVIRRREVLHGQVWLEQPVTVVSDSDGTLAVRLDAGSGLTFPTHPFGPHPWSRHESWSGSTVLQLKRDLDPYAVWKVFEIDGSFRHWYVNFEAPIVRGPDYFDLLDHGLDLVIDPGGTASWKDVDDLHHQRVEGRIDLDTVGEVLASAAIVSTMLAQHDCWWDEWGWWTPDSRPA